MSSTLAPAAPEAAPKFVNPLTLTDDTALRVDAAVTAMVDSVVGSVEQELRRHARRREVTAAVHRVQRIRHECNELLPGIEVAGSGMVDLLLNGYRTDLIDAFAALNPNGDLPQIEAVVDEFLSEYRSKVGTKPKRGKSSGG